jgi:hypothetical protein
MSATPPRVQGAGPILGMHTEEILLSAGFSWDEISALHDCGAIDASRETTAQRPSGEPAPRL